VSDALHSEPRAVAPAQALRALGVECTVESRGNLAIVIPAGGERALEDPTVRRAVLAALQSYGFTHAAVEPGDGPPARTTSDVPRS
jgi:hypothetical protein